jgi:hypothetical protein
LQGKAGKKTLKFPLNLPQLLLSYHRFTPDKTVVMKKNSLPVLLITIVFLTSLSIISCKKETSNSELSPQQEEEVATLSSQAETENELVFNDVFDNVMGVNTEVGLGGIGVFGRTAGTLQNGRETDLDSIPRCVTLTVTRLNASEPFPVNIVIDFGSGCLGKDGRTRYGKIISTYTGRLTVPGKSATTIFDGYKIDSFSVEGTHKITNTTAAGSNQRQFTIDINEAKISKPNGNYSHWSNHRVITQIEGNGTPDLPLDDIFSIEGSGHGKVKRGNELYAWHSEIAEPLRKRFGCRWISRGIIKVWRETLSSNSQWTATLNYGDGTCDFWAKLTVNGVAREVKLPH